MWLSALGEMLGDAFRLVIGSGCAACGTKRELIQIAGEKKVHRVCRPCWRTL